MKENLKRILKENIDKIIFILILIVSCFIRIYKLDLVPTGIHADEARNVL